jgi:diguanylate cyclase (GGDEF)-like protein
MQTDAYPEDGPSWPEKKHDDEGFSTSSLFAGAGDVEDTLGVQVAWRTAAVLYVVAGFGALFELATGLIGDQVEHTWITIGLSIFALIMSVVWWYLGEIRANARYLHAGVILAYGILAVMFADAPAVQAQLGIVYLVPLIFVALFLPSRSLVFYVGLSIALILFASFRNVDETFGIIPGVIAIVALASTAGLTLYVRLELDRIGRQAAALSGRDPLTGLANLRPLYERVERSLYEAERGHGGVTVVMLDLEAFKRVNDEYSHSVGDETLRAVARAITDTVRKDELVVRRGGDEFAIVTGATDADDIASLVRRVSHNVSDARVDMLPGVRSGVTVGFATSEEGDTVGRLLARADRELHKAKARARIERWSWRQRRLDGLADELDAS